MTHERVATTRKPQALPLVDVAKVLATRPLATEEATNATTDRAFLEVGNYYSCEGEQAYVTER